MLAVVLLFFGTIIGVNIVMVISATGTFPGLVVKNSYVASQNFNRTLAEARAQAETGWRMELDADDGVDRGPSLRPRRRPAPRLASPPRPDARRPPARTARSSWSRTSAGYRAAEALPPGLWEIAIEARRDGTRVFGARERIHVGGKGG